MNMRGIRRMDRIAHGAPVSVAYVKNGLNVVTIMGTMEQRKPLGAWRINTLGRDSSGFVRPEDRVTFFEDGHIRVDL
ncbi:MAG TPA: hypothetical protein P5026_03330 [Kiritimatiellia bacterium]|nr:hypothetical protein [Kiritimatiellia bacterium]